jgi:hypothetical protein
MAESKPVNLTLEYADGTRITRPFSSLPLPLQSGLLQQPAFSRSSPDPENDNFLLLEWDDGWQEVIKVDNDCREVNRYYVISRPEDTGRLSLTRENGYPELIEIIRKPLQLKKIHFLDSFGLNVASSVREGQKTDHFFSLEPAEPLLAEILSRFKKIVREEGVDPSRLQHPSSEAEIEARGKIWQALGLRAGQRQQDVYDFITFLAKNVQ